MLRVVGFLELREMCVVTQRIRAKILETFLMSWSPDLGISLGCNRSSGSNVGWDVFIWCVTKMSVDDLKSAVANIDTDAGYLNGTATSLTKISVAIHC